MNDDELLDIYAVNLHELATSVKCRDTEGIAHCNVIGKLIIKALSDRGLIYRETEKRN